MRSIFLQGDVLKLDLAEFAERCGNVKIQFAPAYGGWEIRFKDKHCEQAIQDVCEYFRRMDFFYTVR